MNSPTTTEEYQRMAARLAMALWETLPGDAVEFLDLQRRTSRLFEEVTDAGLDGVLLGDARLRAPVGEATCDALRGMPGEITGVRH